MNRCLNNVCRLSDSREMKKARVHSYIMQNLIQCAYKLPWEIEIYHDFQAYSLRTGFHWIRYRLSGERGFAIKNLKCPFYSKSCDYKEVRDRFVRWFNWMKGKR